MNILFKQTMHTRNVISVMLLSKPEAPDIVDSCCVLSFERSLSTETIVEYIFSTVAAACCVLVNLVDSTRFNSILFPLV